MAFKRRHVPKQNYEVVRKYLMLVPSELAVYLEDPLRVPKNGWEVEDLFTVTRD